MGKTGKNEDDKIIIKKYANRRLYDTARSAYVTLDDLSAMVHDGTDFIVQDAKTGEDLTHSVLTQIIFEQEAQGEHLLPVDFLRQLIRFYGDSMQSVVPGFLDMSMNSLAQGRERFAEQMGETFSKAPLGIFEEQVRQNMTLFENALSAFSPFGQFATPTQDKADPNAGAESDQAPKAQTQPNAELEELRAQMAAMQAQLNKLT